MLIEQQDKCLPIENFDSLLTEKVINKKHGSLLPNSFRAIVAGPSGCGKTNAVLSLIFHPNGVRFENLYVYSKSLYQPKYELLQDVLKQVKGVRYFPFEVNEDIIDLQDVRENSIFIFDDVVCDKQDRIREFYSMGRHKSVDTFFLTQTYTKIQKQILRDNTSLILLFRQDDVNLKHVFDEHIAPDMSLEDFKMMCAKCWQNKYGFLTVVKDCDLNKGRYRLGFDQYIKL